MTCVPLLRTLACPAAEDVSPGDRRIGRVDEPDTADVGVALNRRVGGFRRLPVVASARLPAPHRIVGAAAADEHLGVAVSVLRVDPVCSAVAGAPAVTEVADAELLVAAAEREQRALRVGGAARDDVDGAVHGVGAPQAGARAADDLDALDVVDENVLRVPEDAGEERRVDRPAVDHHLELVRAVDVQPARVDHPGAAVEAADEERVREAEGFGEIADASAVEVFARQHLHGRGGTPDRVRTPGGGGDVDVEQLFDAQLLPRGLVCCGHLALGRRLDRTTGSTRRTAGNDATGTILSRAACNVLRCNVPDVLRATCYVPRCCVRRATCTARAHRAGGIQRILSRLTQPQARGTSTWHTARSEHVAP